jgi:uncharacterized membrane protein YesL
MIFRYEDSECNPTEKTVVLLYLLKFAVDFELLNFSHLSVAFVLGSIPFKTEDTWWLTAVMYPGASLCSAVRRIKNI